MISLLGFSRTVSKIGPFYPADLHKKRVSIKVCAVAFQGFQLNKSLRDMPSSQQRMAILGFSKPCMISLLAMGMFVGSLLNVANDRSHSVPDKIGFGFP